MSDHKTTGRDVSASIITLPTFLIKSLLKNRRLACSFIFGM
ncbi:hypothetical protein ANACOL_03925 [Anaerotruncus colihominis DSM 17241]|uniref:Uncharacterized protein n=1 Tax=Anaerotruncus colihominis DSM 17241 TaxID=445972 RepID=B0PGQ7_9FIRM|nr:hypothetical protein ANACOL_03925 [Anaerotruncus colihominis DSM 17241]